MLHAPRAPTERLTIWFTRPEPAPPLDALILVPPGSLSDFAEDLGAELVRLGIRMRVRSVRSQAESPLKAAVGEDAEQARLCVVLGMRGDSPCYALMPAPRVRGEEPKFAPQGRHGAPDEVEIGPLTEDARTLAGKIAARLSSGERS
jgi:hypothetical protein